MANQLLELSAHQEQTPVGWNLHEVRLALVFMYNYILNFQVYGPSVLGHKQVGSTSLA